MQLSKLIASLCVLLVCSVSLSNDDEARAYYDQGKYQQSIDAIQARGISNPSDYYNLGLSYFRLNQHGRALAYFFKAKALTNGGAGNDDINHNINLAEAALNSSGLLMKDASIWRGTIVPTAKMLGEEGFVLALCLVTVFIILLAQRSRRSGIRLGAFFSKPSVIIASFFWIILAASCVTLLLARGVQQAVIISDSCTARSGPAESFTEMFRITAGTKVEDAGNRKDGWVQIRFSLGNVGWVLEKDILKL